MRKILPLVMLVSTACGDTNNYYSVNGGSAGEDGEELDCEGAISRVVFECEYYKGTDQQKNYTVGVRECEEVPFPQEYKNCVANSSCSEIKSGKCDSLIPNY